MPLISIDNYGQQSTSSDYNKPIFWKLTISADYGSPRAKLKVNPETGSLDKKNGKEIRGRYEDGWFLGRFKDGVFIAIHQLRDSMDWYLCNRAFEVDGEKRVCPICEEYFSDKENSRFGATQHRYILPFLATRRQHDKHIHKGKFKILPIYWFEMNVTAYRDDCAANYHRLNNANANGKINKTPYRIFARDRAQNSIQEYYFFKHKKEKKEHQIQIEHSILEEWLDENTGKWLFNREYQEMLSSMVIARYKPYVDPVTHEVFDYGGEYPQAMEVFGDILERYGESKEPVEEGEYEEEYEDDDIE